MRIAPALQPLRFLTSLKHLRLQLPRQHQVGGLWSLFFSGYCCLNRWCRTGPQSELAKVEDVAKQLDFGSVTVLAQSGNQQDCHHHADAAAACARQVTQDPACCISLTAVVEGAASQSQVTPYCEDSDSDNSSSHRVFQPTAASVRPSCRRRAALDSDSESEQVASQCQRGATQLIPAPLTSVYSFDVSDYEHDSDIDTLGADSSLPLEASPSNATVHQHHKGASDPSVIVLDSSDDEANVTSCRRNSYLLCRCVLAAT